MFFADGCEVNVQSELTTCCTLYTALLRQPLRRCVKHRRNRKKCEQSPTNTMQRTFGIVICNMYYILLRFGILIQILPNDSFYQFVLVRLYKFSAIHRNFSNESIVYSVQCTCSAYHDLQCAKIENQFHHFILSLHQQLIEHMLIVKSQE